MADAGLSSPEEISVISYAPLLKYLGLLLRNVETEDEYVAFYGVPYAKSPEKLERYQAPKSFEVPARATLLPDTYDARKARQWSVQLMNYQVCGSQDCLHMNIFLPKRPECIKGLLPVLVFFLGTGFTKGNNHPESITPDSIIQHNVIFITVSYRLGLQGFFNMHEKKCPGNAGLKDQVKALEWIRDNIENFKGDPKNVTINGWSSGATCVNLHLIAPMSKGLFHKAIIQSGGVYCPWGYQGHGCATKERLINDWECNGLLFTESDTVRLHQRVEELLLSDAMIRHPFSSFPMFGPTKETIEEGAFIPEKIEEMMQAEVDPKIPILAGITKNEGLTFSMVGKGNYESSWICEPRCFLRFLVDNFRWSPQTASECIDLIRDRYCRNIQFMTIEEIKRCISKLLHDIYFHRFYDNFKFGPEKTLHKNLFVYQFEHFSEVCRISRSGLRDSLPAEPTHSDDVEYLYMYRLLRDEYKKNIEPGPEQNPEIKIVMNHMCSLWANFCKTGVPKSDFAPDVKWRQHTEVKPCYLRISADLFLQEGESLCEADWYWLNSLVNSKPVVESRPPTPDLTRLSLRDTL